MRRLLPLLSIVGLLLPACASQPERRGTSASPKAGGPPAASPAAALSWERIDAKGPSARRDFSFVGDSAGRRAFLFGGRSGTKSLGDLWVFDLAAKSWKQIGSEGPSPRFGANVAFVDGRLVLFGGQGGPSDFFNDTWSFDPNTERWTELKSPAAPSPRYGAGTALVGKKLLISHGFTNQGRFDDTWLFAGGSGSWTEGSPADGARPLKRCLLRMAWLESKGRVVLFGGQANENPFLGDTWEYDPASKRWAELKVEGPSPRNLYGLGATVDRIFLFGGADKDGPRNDLWSFDGASWSQLTPKGDTPEARSGIESAQLGQDLLVFGGRGTSGELDDLWRLPLS